jgi:hypothetical protein
MQTYTIINKSKGSPDNSQNTLLHLYNQTLGSGARVAQGDGTASGLLLFANHFGVENSYGFHTKVGTFASANRAVNLPDGNGFIVLGDGSGISSVSNFREALDDQNKLLSADFTTTSNTPQAVTGFTLPLEASSTYYLKGVFRVKAADSTHSIRPRLTGPSSSLSHLTVTASRNDEFFDLTAFDVDANFTHMEAANTPELVMMEGILATNSTTPGSDLGVSIKAETSNHQVEILAGSLLSLKKV